MQIQSEKAKFKEAQIKFDSLCNELKKNQGSRGNLLEKLGDL